MILVTDVPYRLSGGMPSFAYQSPGPMKIDDADLALGTLYLTEII